MTKRTPAFDDIDVVIAEDVGDADLRVELRTEALNAWKSLGNLDGITSLAPIAVRFTITPRFHDEVLAAARVLTPSADYFLQDRPGEALVSAKTVATAIDQTRFSIVISADYLENQYHRMSMFAHEILHTFYYRASHLAGVRPRSMAFEQVRWLDFAREVAFSLADEYRADRLADVYMQSVAFREVDGESRPVTWIDEFGDGIEVLHGLLAPLSKIWPAAIERRDPGIETEVAAVLDLIIRKQAHQDGSEPRGQEHVSILDNAAFDDTMTAQLLRPDMRKMVEFLQSLPVVPSLAEAFDIDARIAAEGEQIVRSIYGTVGLSLP